jgi:hypothetical protein
MREAIRRSHRSGLMREAIRRSHRSQHNLKISKSQKPPEPGIRGTRRPSNASRGHTRQAQAALGAASILGKHKQRSEPPTVLIA